MRILNNKKNVTAATLLLGGFCLTLSITVDSASNNEELPVWTPEQKQQLLSISLSQLPKSGKDLSNRYQQDKQAIALGAKLFFDTRLSKSGTISCSVCHQPNRDFSDGLKVASGLAKGTRNTPSLLGASHQTWFFWDGRKDSLWAQALEPIENPIEHDLSRTQALKFVLSDADYRKQYESIFKHIPTRSAVDAWPNDASPQRDLESLKTWKSLPSETRHEINVAFSNLGKAIAAYEATLNFKPSRFDQYLDDLADNKASTALSKPEVAGLSLFIDKAQCSLCHFSPLLSSQHFQNIGTGIRGKDMGRSEVAETQAWDIFNCLGKYSDAPEGYCKDLEYMSKDRHSLSGSFKVPSLRNIMNTAPYMHDGRFKTLEEVIELYTTVPEKRRLGNHLPPITLDETEKNQLLQFLKTL